MSASLVLTLDTTAPEVTWGGASGASAGETLAVLYTATEPLAAAKLKLADGRVLDLEVQDLAVVVPLPAGTPAGPAAITVFDDVGNSRLYESVVVLEGVELPPPSTGGGGLGTVIIAPHRPSKKKKKKRPKRRVIERSIEIPVTTTLLTYGWMSLADDVTVTSSMDGRGKTSIRATETVKTSQSLRGTARPVEGSGSISIGKTPRTEDPDLDLVVLIELLD